MGATGVTESLSRVASPTTVPVTNLRSHPRAREISVRICRD